MNNFIFDPSCLYSEETSLRVIWLNVCILNILTSIIGLPIKFPYIKDEKIIMYTLSCSLFLTFIFNY